MFAANKFLATNITAKLQEDLKAANEVTSRMDKDRLNAFKDLYTSFHTALHQIEDRLLITLTGLLYNIETEFYGEFEHLRFVCAWKQWLYGYQEYAVQKNFIRPRDAYEERHFHIIALAYTEYILMIENNIKELNSSMFEDNAVRAFLNHQTISKLLNRQEIIRRSLINYTELLTAYGTGIGIFNYTYDHAPKSHNDYVVPVHLLNDSLSHNNYAVKFSARFESYLNRSFDILTYLAELTETAYMDRNVTEDQMRYGREEFRWLMRNWVYAKSVVNYEIIERPYRVLMDRHAEFDRKCFSADTAIESLEETIQSLKRKVMAINKTLFTPLHTISVQIDQYFSNYTGVKFDIATQFLSGQVKMGKLDLDNLLQLILKDDSDIRSTLDQLHSMKTDIYDTIVNDEDSYIYYKFSNNYDFLRNFDDIKAEISSNYTELSSMVRLYETVGEDGAEFIKSITNLETYFISYLKMMNINNEFIK